MLKIVDFANSHLHHHYDCSPDCTEHSKHNSVEADIEIESADFSNQRSKEVQKPSIMISKKIEPSLLINTCYLEYETPPPELL